MIRWLIDLPVRRKVLLILAGGMLTLVFDAFIAHWSWNRSTMSWTQAIPVLYGLSAFVALAVAGAAPISTARSDRLSLINGVLGLLVGGAGVVLHSINVIESLEGEEMTIIAIGKTLATSPPIFAPAAFAGVGLLLVALPKITPTPKLAADLAAAKGAEALSPRVG